MEIVQLPYVTHVEQHSTQGEGWLYVGPHLNGAQPGAKFSCSGISCTYKANEEQPGYEGKNWIKMHVIGNGGGAGSTVKMKAENVSLKRTEGSGAFCEETATMNAEFEITEGTEPEHEAVVSPPGWVTHLL